MKEGEAEEAFEGTGVRITVEGKRHLGAVIESMEYKDEFVLSMVEEWVEQIEMLSKIAQIDPHSAYAAFTHGLRHQYTYHILCGQFPTSAIL